MTMEKQICCPKTASSSSSSSSPALSIRNSSQTILKTKTKMKTKPRIRIIHIFAPEIIKTDAANFREIVQRLTGKPIGETRKMRAGFVHAETFGERVKEEEEIWRTANSGGGFLGEEFDGFMHELNHFQLLEMEGLN